MGKLKYKGLLILFFLSFFAFTEGKISGKVVGVKDGDTIEVLHGKTILKVRLFGIDCPELKQDYGHKAKQYTSDLCFGKPVKIIERGKDYFGRTLAEVILPDGKNLNHELVKNGMAWHFKKYSSSSILRDLELQARKYRRGLWAYPHAIPPWDFRKTRKKK